jgi:hypothetical protein
MTCPFIPNARLQRPGCPIAPWILDGLVDDPPVLAFLADEFRQGLADAGFGARSHGFSDNVSRLGLPPDVVIRVKVVTQGVELANSDRRLAEYAGRV